MLFMDFLLISWGYAHIWLVRAHGALAAWPEGQSARFGCFVISKRSWFGALAAGAMHRCGPGAGRGQSG
ncbi:hypothetical protein RA19_07395 [Leisingera sp. ANG-M1]|nr:hypothetical protein RA19_07395 [Leisingera sp. ANG-M1]